MNEWNYNDQIARKSLLQSGTCQAGVNSCQVGLLAAPRPRARAAKDTLPTPSLQRRQFAHLSLAWSGVAW